MKKIIRNNQKSNQNQQEKMIDYALKTGGFLFPQTVEEVEEFERIYGNTDVILPIELNDLTFYKESEKSENVIRMCNDKFAMAAREGISKLPKEIQQKIIDDIMNSENKGKKKKK